VPCNCNTPLISLARIFPSGFEASPADERGYREKSPPTFRLESDPLALQRFDLPTSATSRRSAGLYGYPCPTMAADPLPVCFVHIITPCCWGVNILKQRCWCSRPQHHNFRLNEIGGCSQAVRIQVTVGEALTPTAFPITKPIMRNICLRLDTVMTS